MSSPVAERVFMKRFLVLLLVPAGAGLAWLAGGEWGRSDPGASGVAPGTGETSEPDEPTSLVTDRVAVFQRMFWKRPTEADVIHHPERREWSDADGVQRWQSFLEVEPSQPLRRYLIEENAFSLRSVEAGEVPEGAPGWFEPEGQVWRTADSGMQLWLTEGGRLFAASEGHGFAKPVQAPSTDLASPPSSAVKGASADRASASSSIELIP
jgi:hypothetical protein